MALKDLLKRTSTAKSVVDQPAVVTRHFSGTADPSGTEIDFNAAWGEFPSDTVFVQSLGASGIKVHTHSIDDAGEKLDVATAVANGHSLVRAGGDLSFNIARDVLIVSGTDDYLVTATRAR